MHTVLCNCPVYTRYVSLFVIAFMLNGPRNRGDVVILPGDHVIMQTA